MKEKRQQYTCEFEVSLMCRTLGVSRSGFYAWRKRPSSERARAASASRERRDQRLRLEIRAIHRESRGTYGSRHGSARVHAELRAREVRCGRKRVERLMRGDGLRARERRRFRRTTNSKPSHPVAPNLLDRRFDVEEVNELDRVWVGDITYIPTREGWLYLAVLLDLASRSVGGS